MEFTYLQDIDDIGNEFIEPRVVSYRSLRKEPPGVLWLIKLINNSW
jgi:hypothetical protein